MLGHFTAVVRAQRRQALARGPGPLCRRDRKGRLGASRRSKCAPAGPPANWPALGWRVGLIIGPAAWEGQMGFSQVMLRLLALAVQVKAARELRSAGRPAGR